MPTKLSNGKYKTNLRYPKKFNEITGISSEKFQKTFPTRQLAIKEENEMKKKIAIVLREENADSLELKGQIKFKEFYKSKWLHRYELGQNTRSHKAPSDITIINTKNLFRLHILPIFGEYAMSYLNANTEILSDELTKKSKEFD
nr:integrase [Enterococcus faecium]